MHLHSHCRLHMTSLTEALFDVLTPTELKMEKNDTNSFAIFQGFLNRLVREHGSIDLEWLRDVPSDKAK